MTTLRAALTARQLAIRPTVDEFRNSRARVDGLLSIGPYRLSLLAGGPIRRSWSLRQEREHAVQNGELSDS